MVALGVLTRRSQVFPRLVCAFCSDFDSKELPRPNAWSPLIEGRASPVERDAYEKSEISTSSRARRSGCGVDGRLFFDVLRSCGLQLIRSKRSLPFRQRRRLGANHPGEQSRRVSVWLDSGRFWSGRL